MTVCVRTDSKRETCDITRIWECFDNDLVWERELTWKEVPRRELTWNVLCEIGEREKEREQASPKKWKNSQAECLWPETFLLLLNEYYVAEISLSQINCSKTAEWVVL